MKKKVKLADVLWDAANKHLATDKQIDDCSAVGRKEYSCHAVYEAINFNYVYSIALKFLKSLGCNPHQCGTETWDCWEGRQGIRYMWLLLAMHVAEDEGIEIEVEA